MVHTGHTHIGSCLHNLQPKMFMKSVLGASQLSVCIIITTWSTGTFALAPTLAGTEELRGGGGRLGAARFLVEAILWRGGRGSLSSTEKSTRLGYILLVGDRVLSMAPSTGDGKLITYPQCESYPPAGDSPCCSKKCALFRDIAVCIK